MNKKTGFSLIEITIATLAMGLTITALLDFFNWTLIRYREENSDRSIRSAVSTLKLKLRELPESTDPASLDTKSIAKLVALPENIFVNSVKIRTYSKDTWLVSIELYEDKNRNSIAESTEIQKELFCIRRRSA